MQRMINSFFDNFPRTHVYLFGYTLSAFQTAGYVGLAAAVMLILILTAIQNLPFDITLIIIFFAITTFFVLNKIIQVITGDERMVNYHHQILVAIVTTITLKLLNQPVLPFLEITMLSVGLFIAFGRIGCLMVGCCHGYPCRIGICYNTNHLETGLAPYFIGTRLFPIQAVESLGLFLIVCIGCFLVVTSESPGYGLMWYVTSYSILRFFIEIARADPDRPYYIGFSETQWLSLTLAVVTTVLSLIGLLPYYPIIFALVLIVSALIMRLYFIPLLSFQMRFAYHVRELASALEVIDEFALQKCEICEKPSVTDTINMASTSIGLQISASRIKTHKGYIRHFAFSFDKGNLSEWNVQQIASLIKILQHLPQNTNYTVGTEGIFHLIAYPQNSRNYTEISDS